MKVLVTGVTRSGNLGGTAMLYALKDVLGARVDDLALASILPRQDRALAAADCLRIVSADYRLWLLVVAPLCIVLWPLRRVGFVRRLASRLPILRLFAETDAVADLSGIAFADGRGLALLYYNVAILLPAFFLDVPVHKLAQALGPFETPLNRRVARWALARCRSVATRGRISQDYVAELGIKSARLRPDSSYALVIPEDVRAAARAEISSKIGRDAGQPLVVMSPSAVVARYCRETGLDFVAVVADALSALAGKGYAIGLLAHSTDTGIAKNDDHSVVVALIKRLRDLGRNAVAIEPHGDPRLARALIGEADVFIACRFHSLIASLSQAVPVVTVSWSHKYREAAEPFGMTPFILDYARLDAKTLGDHVETLRAGRAELRGRMEAAAAEAAQGAREGISVVLEGVAT